jgi:hypothetical protein
MGVPSVKCPSLQILPILGARLMYAVAFLVSFIFFLNIFIQFLQNVKNSLQLPDEFISCIGLAMSPGNLVVAVV